MLVVHKFRSSQVLKLIFSQTKYFLLKKQIWLIQFGEQIKISNKWKLFPIKFYKIQFKKIIEQMFKQLLILTIFVIAAFSQASPMGSIIGGFKVRTEEQLNQRPQFPSLTDQVKAFWKTNMAQDLGNLKSTEEQIVAGVNYKFTFQASAGNSDSEVVVIVWAQPWTNTYKVTFTKPQMPTGITNQNLKVTKRKITSN